MAQQQKTKDRGVFQRKGRAGWWIRYTHEGKECVKACDNKSQAIALRGKILGEIREGLYFPEKYKPKTDAVTLRTLIKEYLAGSSNKGIENERRYGRFWSKLLGNQRLTELTTLGLKKIQAQMHKKGRKSPATVNRYFSFLRHLLTLAVHEGTLNRNPLVGVKQFDEERTTRFLTDSELAQLKAHLSPDDWQLVSFAVNTGLRQEEQFSLRWNQVDLERRIVTLPMPKAGETKQLPLNPAAIAILRSIDSVLDGSPFVWPNPRRAKDGSLRDPLHHRSASAFYNKVYAPALIKAGIQGATWHTLRHTKASRAVMAGVDLFTVGKLLGHQDVTTTARYAHLSPEHLQEAAEKGSLTETVTRSVTNPKHHEPATSVTGS